MEYCIAVFVTIFGGTKQKPEIGDEKGTPSFIRNESSYLSVVKGTRNWNRSEEHTSESSHSQQSRMPSSA